MKRTLMVMLCAMAACDEAEAPEPKQVYQPLGWAEVEAVLPRVPAARELGRQVLVGSRGQSGIRPPGRFAASAPGPDELPAALGIGLCLEHEHPAARVDEALAAAGWKVTSRDALTEERIDWVAEREGLQLSGSLTAAPAEGCPSGFLYTVRKQELVPSRPDQEAEVPR